MTHRTWHDNAEEFGALTKQGVDVRLAALVACSVEKVGRGKSAIADSKTTASQFARASSTTDTRIKRHLTAWDKCAANGWCKPSADLNPDDVNATEVPTQEQFTSVFDATGSGGRPRDSKPEDAVLIIEKRGAKEVVATMTPEVRESLASAIEEAEDTDRELRTIARGGKVSPPRQSPADHPLDGIGERVNDYADLMRGLKRAERAAERMVRLTESEFIEVQRTIMSIMDRAPQAANL